VRLDPKKLSEEIQQEEIEEDEEKRIETESSDHKMLR